MPLALLVIVVGALAFLWLWSARRSRERWLRSLDLVGKWELDPRPPRGGSRSLTLSGELASGSYLARDGDTTERGKWRLSGHTLTLEPEGAEAPAYYDLHLFASGRIGLDGPGREREIYVKCAGNVIPLRARS